MAKAPPKLSARLGTSPAGQEGAPGAGTNVPGLYRAEDFEKRLEQATAGAATNIKISLLKDSPFQVLKINRAKVEELKANIQAAGRVIYPVLVRRLKDGTFELVAGHHRKQACLELGMETITAVVVEIDDGFARFAVIYDNIHARKLTDYELFLSFKNRLETMRFSQKELAEESGLSDRQIGRIMAFESLPDECHAMLREQLDLLGATAADDLREQVAESREALVIEALKLIAEKKLEQSKAVEWILQQARPQKSAQTAAAPQWEPKPIYAAGKKLVCTVRRTSGKVLVDFSKPEYADKYSEQLMEKIEATVREYLGQS